MLAIVTLNANLVLNLKIYVLFVVMVTIGDKYLPIVNVNMGSMIIMEKIIIVPLALRNVNLAILKKNVQSVKIILIENWIYLVEVVVVYLDINPLKIKFNVKNATNTWTNVFYSALIPHSRMNKMEYV